MSSSTLLPSGILAVVIALGAGCGQAKKPTADPQPFKKAIAEYLDRNNMALAVKGIVEGPTIDGHTATLSAALTHAELGGASVTWEFTFQKNPNGTWRVVGEKR